MRITEWALLAITMAQFLRRQVPDTPEGLT